jgi:hypothetical protein
MDFLPGNQAFPGFPVWIFRGFHTRFSVSWLSCKDGHWRAERIAKQAAGKNAFASGHDF